MKCDVIYKIRDGVDIYINHNELLTIYFMNTRLRKQFRVSSVIVNILEFIDGKSTLKEIHSKLEDELNKKMNIEDVMAVIEKLKNLNVIIEKIKIPQDNELIERYSRQINFLGILLMV